MVGGLNLSGGAGLVMDLGDRLSTTAAITAGNITIALTSSGNVTSGTGYSAIQATGGGLASATYNLLANNPNYTATLSVTSTSVTVKPTSLTPLSSAYWYGGEVAVAPAAMALSNGTLSNWSTGQGYAATGLVPGADGQRDLLRYRRYPAEQRRAGFKYGCQRPDLQRYQHGQDRQ